MLLLPCRSRYVAAIVAMLWPLCCCRWCHIMVTVFMLLLPWRSRYVAAIVAMSWPLCYCRWYHVMVTVFMLLLPCRSRYVAAIVAMSWPLCCCHWCHVMVTVFVLLLPCRSHYVAAIVAMSFLLCWCHVMVTVFMLLLPCRWFIQNWCGWTSCTCLNTDSKCMSWPLCCCHCCHVMAAVCYHCCHVVTTVLLSCHFLAATPLLPCSTTVLLLQCHWWVGGFVACEHCLLPLLYCIVSTAAVVTARLFLLRCCICTVLLLQSLLLRCSCCCYCLLPFKRCSTLGVLWLLCTFFLPGKESIKITWRIVLWLVAQTCCHKLSSSVQSQNECCWTSGENSYPKLWVTPSSTLKRRSDCPGEGYSHTVSVEVCRWVRESPTLY